MNNEAYAKLLVEQLIRLGVDYFCVAPGSRSTPLALAVAENKSAKKIVHFDERGLAFHALGYAKAKKKPAAIIVTSGTAVGNLFPGVMEASLARVPLLVLTADRPPELRDCGANQTADQAKIFESYVRFYADMPCPSLELPEEYIASTLAYAVFRAKNAPAGPVHLNCMVREPFFTSAPQAAMPSLIATEYSLPDLVPSEECVKNWADHLSSYKNGAILVGSLDSPVPSILQLGEKLNWPVLTDILSSLRTQETVPYFHHLLHKKPEAILQFGTSFVSKTVLDWTASLPLKFYGQVEKDPFRFDPKHKLTHRLVAEPAHFCEKLFPHLPASTGWVQEWKKEAEEIKETLHEFFSSYTNLSEPGVVRTILEDLPEEWSLFFANSMPVRDADQFLFPTRKIGPIFANRGLSGIDGNIATVTGIAQGLKKPVVAVLGDQTSLHDLNSLALLEKSQTPVILLIINNGGGGIFSFLPVSQKKEHFEEYFAAAHTHSFEKAAELFGISYFAPKQKAEWEELFKNQVQKRSSCIIEIHTDRNENLKLHKEINSLCSRTNLAAR